MEHFPPSHLSLVVDIQSSVEPMFIYSEAGSNIQKDMSKAEWDRERVRGVGGVMSNTHKCGFHNDVFYDTHFNICLLHWSHKSIHDTI